MLEDKLKDPAFVDTMAKFVRASMKGWKWAEENPDDAAMIVLDNDETGAQTEQHQKRMMGEIAKLTAGSDGTLDPADYERTVKTLLTAGSDPVITKEPEGAWSHAVTDKALGELRPRGPGRARPGPPTGGGAWPGARRTSGGCASAMPTTRAGGCTIRSSRRVAEKVFSRGARPAPFVGVPTFLTAPYRRSIRAAPDFAGLDVAIIGVPMDLGVTNRSGLALRAAGAARDRADRALQPRARLRADLRSRVADIGDVPFSSRYRLASSHRRHRGADAAIVDAGVRAAVGRRRPFDHLSDPAGGRRKAGRSGWSISTRIATPAGRSTGCASSTTAAPFRNAVLDGVLDPTRTIQIGIRGAAEYLWEFSSESGMTVHPCRGGRPSSASRRSSSRRGRWSATGRPTSPSTSTALDPAFAPGTGTPEIGGLTTREAQAILRGLKGIDIVGGDVVEVAPQYDATTNTAHAGGADAVRDPEPDGVQPVAEPG